jgi:ABC-2 type transport system ATP-binding protein
VETRPPLLRDDLAALSGVRRCDPEGAGWSLEAESIPRALAELAALAEASGRELTEVRLQKPTLDDVFFELTGHSAAEGDSA